MVVIDAENLFMRGRGMTNAENVFAIGRIFIRAYSRGRKNFKSTTDINVNFLSSTEKGFNNKDKFSKVIQIHM